MPLVHVIVSCPEALLSILLQDLRTMEQRNPEHVHVTITVKESEKNTDEIMDMLTNLQPPLPFKRTIKYG